MPGQTKRLRPLEPVLSSAWHRVEVLPHRGLLTEEERDEYEDEDEVEYVTLEFGSHLTEDELNQYGELQLLGAEAPHPVARVGHKHFQGVHESLIGNDILFKHQPEATPAYVPFAKSSHRITFQPVSIVHDPTKAAGDAAGFFDGANDAAGAGVLGPDGQPIKRKPGRPRGSKNKNPSRRRSGPADPPPQSGDDNDIIHQDFEVVERLRATSEADEAMQDAEEEEEEEGRQNKPGGPSVEGAPQGDEMDE
ncbi:hypothetical protein B0A53_00096 [Rhodotorula sp. CCFEE 5036]|nr:hypothetical protein B0A53_00096 [Rhodotorula sp. CCFEE 5036]